MHVHSVHTNWRPSKRKPGVIRYTQCVLRTWTDGTSSFVARVDRWTTYVYVDARELATAGCIDDPRKEAHVTMGTIGSGSGSGSGSESEDEGRGLEIV